MDTQTQAHLYLSDQRGCSQIDFFRSFHSFTFGRYVDETRQPFGALRVVNDNTLKAGHRVSMQVDEPTDVIIIPVVGGLGYASRLGDGFLEAGQAQVFSLANGMDYTISNPYETELINYIEIWLTNTSPDFSSGIQQLNFDLTTKNRLLPLFDTDQKQPVFRPFIGRYDGREEGIYPIKSAQTNGVFVFILSGAFEVQNRLLHERDGLALMDVQHDLVEFEALSNDALLLLLEIPLRR